MGNPKRRWRTTAAIQARAQELRRELTPAQRVLWRHFRSHRLEGLHFRRQHPIDRFIVDFCCRDRRLIIEIDGPIHRTRRAEDAHRTECLEKMGYRIIRFTNDDVLNRLPVVLTGITAACHQTPTPSPSPVARGRGRRGGSPHVYVSPHLDDVVYSCGGRVWQQAQNGESPLVVTVFASGPDHEAPLSPFAQGLHARWGHPEDAATTRQEEDRSALAILGARVVHWPYTDCIYRRTPDGRFAYDSEESLWAEIHPAEEALIAELAARLAALPLAPGGTVYAPLGLGHHVDHRIVRRAALATRLPIVQYEDFPYAEDPEEMATVLAQTDLAPEVTVLSEPALRAKTAAIACYASQVSTFWSGLDEMAARIRAFAVGIGGEQPAERYWTAVT